MKKNEMKKMKCLIISVLLIGQAASSCVSVSADDADQILNTAQRTEKVFAVTDVSGKLLSVTDTVTLKNPDGAEVLEDKSLLDNIEVIGSDGEVTRDGNTFRFMTNGQDISYQGTSDRELPVAPCVTMQLDGKTVTSSEMADSEGEASIVVSIDGNSDLVYPALSVILLPEEGIDDLKTENASVFSAFGRYAVIGWAVGGADEELQLPDSFSVSFKEDHAAPEWMITLSSADPLRDVLNQMEKWLDLDVTEETGDVQLLLKAIMNGDEELPETDGKTGDVAQILQEIFDGISEINDGANSVADGAETLNEGMQTLSANSESLNEGAQSIVEDILKTANEQLASSELSDAGIEIVELTEENYSDVLDEAINEISQKIADGVKNSKDESGKKLSLADKLALAAKAEAGLSSLKNLKEKLDNLEAFKEGLAAYTDGVDQAAAGSAELASGARSLHDEGTAKLEEKLDTSSKEAAEKILNLYDEKIGPVMGILTKADVKTLNAGYDLRTEDKDTVTVFIIRSEL